MGYTGESAYKISRALALDGMRDAAALAASLTLTELSGQWQSLTPDGDWPVLLPDTDTDGLLQVISHAGSSGAIDVQTPAAASLATVEPGMVGVFFFSNRTVGWALVAILQDVSGGEALAYAFEDIDDLFSKADTEVDHAWVLNSGSDGAAIDPAVNTAFASGVWDLITGAGDGTTAADASGMVWADRPIQLDSLGGDLVLEARIRIDAAITNVAVGFGLTDATTLEEPFSRSGEVNTSNATDAVGFLYDTDADAAEWFGMAVDTDVDDALAGTLGVAPTASVFQTLRLEVSADGIDIRFYVDDVLTLTMAADTGVGPNVVLYPYLIACGDGTASKTVKVDWVRVKGIR